MIRTISLGKRTSLFLCTLFAAVAIAAPSANAETITHEVINGVDSPVSYSWLTSGSNTSGVLGASDHKWRLDGDIDFTFDSNGNITGASGSINVLEDKTTNNSYVDIVGTVSFDDASFDSLNSIWTFDVDFVASDSGSEFHDRIDTYGGDNQQIKFKNQELYSNNPFNSFSKSLIKLWGNELVGSSTTDQDGNWGFDWGSAAVTPEPGSIVLLGLGVIGFAVVRRRRTEELVTE